MDLHFKTNYDLLSFKIFTLFQSKVDSSKYSRSLNKPGLGAYTILKNPSITLRLALAVRGAMDAASCGPRALSHSLAKICMEMVHTAHTRCAQGSAVHLPPAQFSRSLVSDSL